MNESLHNTNADYFKNKVYELTNVNPQEHISKKKSVSLYLLQFQLLSLGLQKIVKLNEKNGEIKSKNKGEDTLFFHNENIRTVIIDCAPLNYIDTYGVKTLNEVFF
jgi:hypothetical protein